MPKPHWPHLIFVSDPYVIYVGYPCSNLGKIVISFKDFFSAVILNSFSCRVFLQSPVSLRYSTWFLYILAAWFCKNEKLRLHIRIRSSSYLTRPLHIDSYSKQCKNYCTISRKVVPRGKSLYNANPLSCYFGIHQPIFVLGPCTLKLSVLSLFSEMFFSGFCFYFDHLWQIFLWTENYWLSCSYYLAKYNRWTCALLEISTRSSPIISWILLHIFWDVSSSIECVCAVLMSRSDKEDIYSRRI